MLPIFSTAAFCHFSHSFSIRTSRHTFKLTRLILTCFILGDFFKEGVWLGAGEMPSDTEEALLLWINRAVLAIKEYIQNNNAHEHNLVIITINLFDTDQIMHFLNDVPFM